MSFPRTKSFVLKHVYAPKCEKEVHLSRRENKNQKIKCVKNLTISLALIHLLTRREELVKPLLLSTVKIKLEFGFLLQ